MSVTIHGRVYSVDTFQHPGGKRILQSYHGRDASTAFDMFHKNSRDKVDKYLRLLPSTPVDPGVTGTAVDTLQRDLRKLRDRLEAEGMFVPVPASLWCRLAVATALVLCGLWMSTLGAGGWFCAGIGVAGLGWSQYGWIQHEAGHGSFTADPKRDKWIQWLLFDGVFGGSHRFWNYQHNNHHANTQHIKHDLDLETHPIFCYSQTKFNHEHLQPNVVLRMSRFLWPVYNGFVLFLWGLLVHPRYEIRKGNWKYVPLAILFVYLRALGVACVTGYSMWKAFGVSVAVAFVGMMILLTVFVVSHVPTESHFGTDDFVTTTAKHTINIRPNACINWFMGYLNLQIEHHLFTSMPQCNLPRVRPLVQELFRQHGLPYQEFGFWEAYARVFRHIWDVAGRIGKRGPHTSHAEKEKKSV